MDSPSFVIFPEKGMIGSVDYVCEAPGDINSGYLYAVEFPEGRIKVGISRTPGRRFRNLQTDSLKQYGSPLGRALVTKACSNYKALESVAHQALWASWSGGEFFRTTIEEAAPIFASLDYAPVGPDSDHKALSFRSMPKVSFQVLIPRELSVTIGERAVTERKQENALVTELLALALGLDPADFGL